MRTRNEPFMSAVAGLKPHSKVTRARPYLLARQRIAQRRLVVCGVLLVLLIAAMIMSAAYGPAQISYGDVAKLILRGLGVGVGIDFQQGAIVPVNMILLPRSCEA